MPKEIELEKEIKEPLCRNPEEYCSEWNCIYETLNWKSCKKMSIPS